MKIRPHQIRFRLYGTAIKSLAYIYHAVLPKKRFVMPEHFPAEKFPGDESLQKIPRVVWQTNFTDKCSFPVWMNYRINRRMAKGYEFRYVSTEARDEYMKEHSDARTYRAYCRLTNGAAQADLWRIVQLYNEGGIYLDIDACLINPLWKLLEGKEQLWISAHGYRATNFFLATVPGNPVFREYLESVLERIENYPKENGPSVFYVTGPGAVRHILARHGITPTPRNLVCLTGAIVNERFQYIDRPRSKWTYCKTFIK